MDRTELEKKLHELPVFMQKKSIVITEAIGAIGPMEAEAIVVLLEAAIEGLKKIPAYSKELEEFIKNDIGMRITVSDAVEIEKIRQLEKFKLEKMQEKQ
jgi:hypothetical protein